MTHSRRIVAAAKTIALAAAAVAGPLSFDDAVTWWRMANNAADTNAPPASDGTVVGSLGYVAAPVDRYGSNGVAADFSGNDRIEFSTAAGTELDTDWSGGLTAFARVKFDSVPGSAQELLYDSGGHDADIDWGVRGIAFTRQSCIWMMDADGSNDHAVTDWDSAGIWGDAVLPFGDYDPRIHPDSSWIVFSRLVDDASSHGIYEIMRLDLESDDLLPLTGQPWTQGFASWSHDGTRIVFVVAAIAGEGQYRIYEMDAGGAGLRNITPDYFPQTLLCHAPIFTPDDRAVYFAGEWWE